MANAQKANVFVMRSCFAYFVTAASLEVVEDLPQHTTVRSRLGTDVEDLHSIL